LCGISAVIGEHISIPFGNLLHRGPDQICLFHTSNLSCTFNRLAITGGDQGEAPVTSNDGRWTCFLNGEIYNFRELANEIGTSFYKSDTRILVEGFSKQGLDFFYKIEGMYAFLLIDNLNLEYYLGRDPLGEKPLFYQKIKDKMLISSEVSSLIRQSDSPIDLNIGALEDYFRFGYIEEPWTIDSRIHAVERGTLSKVTKNLDLQNVRLKTFNNLYVGYLFDELIELLNKQIVPSDVGQVVLLSGGIDSASLLKHLSKNQSETTIALTLQTSGKLSKNETESALKTAKKFGVNHKILHWTPNQLISDLEILAKANDQPHSDMSGIAYFKLFENIRSLNKKVAVTGHGPDELFWGYDWYNEELKKGKKITGERVFWDTPASLKRILDVGVSFPDKQLLSKIDPFLLSKDKYSRYRAEIVHSYLSHNALRQSDRLAMYWSIEPRTPYSDSRLYIWAQNNPKLANIARKKIFKQSFNKNPLSRLMRRQKRGFDIGMMDFINSPTFAEEFENVLRDLQRRPIPWFQKLTKQTFSSREKYRLVMLEYWFRSATGNT
jgi:asparagine synthase (glutamine-hydrolysing)